MPRVPFHVAVLDSISKVNDMRKVSTFGGVLWVCLCLCLFVGACGDDEPANVAGTYTLNVTNGQNGCNFSGFGSGISGSNVSLAMVQDGRDVSGTVGGVAGNLLSALLGSNRFQGDVDESRVHMEIEGNRAGSEGNCAFTVNATLKAFADGDFLEGNIEYTRVDNGNSDCAALRNCVSVQSFNGARPPQ